MLLYWRYKYVNKVERSMALAHSWYFNIDKGDTNLIVLLDLAKALHTVSHCDLIEKASVLLSEGFNA